MTTIDIILLIIIGASLVLGLYKGIIAQIASIGGVVLGIIACRFFATDIGSMYMSWAPDTFSNETLANIAGGITVYLVVYFGIGLFASLLRRITDTLMAGWLDHMLGGIFGIFKWLILTSVFLNLFYMIAPHCVIFHSSAIASGKLFVFVMQLAPKLFGVMAGPVGEMINNIT
ncbi:MAG: CvpA family protein [Muribaculum sp.]|nr:CvpA family protein [Muribaculum sp.]